MVAVYYRRGGTPSLLCNDLVENVVRLHFALCKVIFLYWKAFSITFTRKTNLLFMIISIEWYLVF